MPPLIVKVLVGVALLAGYSILFVYWDTQIGILTLPQTWPWQISIAVQRSFAWHMFSTILVVLVIGSLVGVACRRFFRSHGVTTALLIGVLTFVLTQYEMLAFASGTYGNGWIWARLGIYAFALAAVPALAAMISARVISNPSLERP